MSLASWCWKRWFTILYCPGSIAPAKAPITLQSSLSKRWCISLDSPLCWSFNQWCQSVTGAINSLRPRQNDRLFADDTFKRILLNEIIRISTKNSLKFIPKGLINNIPALALIMAWCRPGDKPLSEPMLVRSLTHICVTRPQWVNTLAPGRFQFDFRFSS